MASPDLPEDTAEAAASDLGQTLDDSCAAGRHVAAVPPADVPVYRPRDRAALRSFVAGLVLAAVVSAAIAWLLMR